MQQAKAEQTVETASDSLLMLAVGDGDASAFRLLVERHHGLVFRIAWRMLNDASEAEDVAQECFTRLWTQAPGWSPQGGGLGGWLRRVATNACLDRIRKHRRLSDEPVPDMTDEAPLPDAQADSARQRDAVVAAVQALPDRQRAAIVLTYYEDMSNAEAAATLDMHLKAFESLLLRARAALRSALLPPQAGTAGGAP